MLWNILDKESFILYVNRDIDLKIKVIGVNEKDEIFMNYKGYNLYYDNKGNIAGFSTAVKEMNGDGYYADCQLYA